MHEKLTKIGEMLRQFQKGFPNSSLTAENVVYYAEELLEYDIRDIERALDKLKRSGTDFFPALPRIIGILEEPAYVSSGDPWVPDAESTAEYLKRLHGGYKALPPTVPCEAGAHEMGAWRFDASRGLEGTQYRRGCKKCGASEFEVRDITPAEKHELVVKYGEAKSQMTDEEWEARVRFLREQAAKLLAEEKKQ